MIIKEGEEDIIYRVLSGEATEVEESVFQQILLENSEAEREVKNIKRTWWRVKYAGKWEKTNEDEAWKTIENTSRRRIRRRRWWYGSVAAVLILMIGAGVWQFQRRSASSDSSLAENIQPIDSGHSRALLVLASGEKIELDEQLTKTITDGEVAIVGDSVGLTYRLQTTSTEQLFNELIVPVGGEYRLCLSDGTIVYLNAESRLRYPVNFGPGKREVELEGEAYFEVTADPNRPFQVNTTDLEVRVLGTGFNVAAYKSSHFSEVTLAHGSVAVGKNGKELVLKPDEQLIWDKPSAQVSIRSVDAHKICAWKNGILYFEGMPLEDLAVKLSRWFDVQFFFTSEKLKQLKFTGAFKKYNNIAYVLSLIEATTDIHMQIKDRTIVVNYK